jgi:uridine kinase
MYTFTGGYMRKPIYLVVGVPGSGKTWVCEQLKEKFDYLKHDDYISAGQKAYVHAAGRLADFSEKPVLIETPFSVSQIYEPLMRQGYRVIPVFIIETDEVVSKRYKDREGKDIIPGHLSRVRTYIDRAREMKCFSGTSSEVLSHLRSKVS